MDFLELICFMVIFTTYTSSAFQFKLNYLKYENFAYNYNLKRKIATYQ